jgi:hypothetical protein
MQRDGEDHGAARAVSDRHDLSRKGKAHTGGKQKGTPNRSNGTDNYDVRKLARGYGPQVVEGLWKIFDESKSETARIAAGKELLDRAYGRPAVPVTGEADGEPVVIKHIVEWLK